MARLKRRASLETNASHMQGQSQAMTALRNLFMMVTNIAFTLININITKVRRI